MLRAACPPREGTQFVCNDAVEGGGQPEGVKPLGGDGGVLGAEDDSGDGGYEADAESDAELGEGTGGGAVTEGYDASSSEVKANTTSMTRRQTYVDEWLKSQSYRYTVQLQALLPEHLSLRVYIAGVGHKNTTRGLRDRWVEMRRKDWG